MTTEEHQLRRIVVSASGLIYWGGVLIQARRVRRHIGHSPNLKPRGPKEKVLWLGWFAVIAVWIALSPAAIPRGRCSSIVSLQQACNFFSGQQGGRSAAFRQRPARVP